MFLREVAMPVCHGMSCRVIPAAIKFRLVMPRVSVAQ